MTNMVRGEIEKNWNEKNKDDPNNYHSWKDNSAIFCDYFADPIVLCFLFAFVKKIENHSYYCNCSETNCGLFEDVAVEIQR